MGVTTAHLAIALLLSVAPLTAVECAAQIEPVPEMFPWDRRTPYAGLWAGRLTMDGRALYAQVRIAAADPDARTVEVTIPQLGVFEAPGRELTTMRQDLQFRFEIDGRPLRVLASVLQQGQVLAGVMRDAEKVSPVEAGRFRFTRTVPVERLPEPLAFSGELVLDGQPAAATLLVARTPGGFWIGQLDVPSRAPMPVPLAAVEVDENRLSLLVPLGEPAAIDAALEPVPATAGPDATTRRIRGTLRQGGAETAVILRRDRDYAHRHRSRPQHPAPPFPYETREIVVPRGGGGILAGTLSLPDAQTSGARPSPLVLIVAGVPGLDRDGAGSGHRPFLVIADHLARRGVAVARYDGRGAGGSSGPDDDATLDDATADALAVLDHVAALDAIDGGCAGVLGHGTGGLIAARLAGRRPDLDFAVLLATPGVRGDRVLIRRRELAWALAGAAPGEVEELSAAYAAIVAHVVDRTPAAALRPGLEGFVRLEVAAGVVPETVDLEARIASLLAELDTAPKRERLAHDPAGDLAAVRCPVLAQHGALDREVWHGDNLDAVERALDQGGAEVTAKRYAGINHLLQPAETGGESEHAEIEITIAPRVLEDLSAWIGARIAACRDGR